MVFPALVDWFSRPSGNTGCTTCGLFRTTNGTEIPVPLKRRDVSATVYADASFADTTENLRYKSDAECSAVFRFPLPPCAAVYRFRAVFGDREVVTKVKPRAAAREEYDFAVSQGHSAVHMSQHEAGASVFEVSLGNLAAHTEVTVEFSYLRLLDAFGGTLEWSHTATWVPPYVGSAGDVATGVDKVAAALPTFAPKVTYVLSYEVTVRAEAGTVRAIESPEPVTVERPMPGIKRGEEELWYVRLSEQVADPSKDLSLAIEVDPKAARRSGLRVQRTPASRGGEQRTVALATFVPPLPSPTAAGTDGKQQQLRKEIWFVVDCSGSMDGSPINQAREAALFFVRDLPVDSGVRFNMTVFGSSHKSLYDSCKPYDSKTEKEAVTWIQSNVHADMGGTEIRQTLESIYYTPIAAGYTREVIFLTDGGISGHEEEWMIKTMVSRRRDAASPLPQGGGRDSFARFGPLAHFDSFGPFAHFGPFAKFWNAHPPAPGTTAEQQLQQLEAALQAKVAVFMEYDQHPPHRLQCELQTVARALRAQRAAKAARSTHVLCMGIGHGVHRGLLDGMASASDGAAVYVVEDEGIVAKAAFLKQIAIGRHGLVNVRVRASSALVKMAPHVLPQRVFAGEPLHVLMEVVSSEPDAALELTADWAELPEAEAAGGAGADADTAAVAAAAAAAGGKGDESSKESAASKAGEGAAEQAVAAGVATAVPAAVPAQLLVSLPLGAALLPSPDGKPTVQEGEALPVLHAMAYIGSLMAGTSPLHVRSDGTPLAAPPSADTVKEAVVRLAVAEHLVTPHTSAVGVSLRKNLADPEAAANVVEVPLQLPHGRCRQMLSTHKPPAQSPAFSTQRTNIPGFSFASPSTAPTAPFPPATGCRSGFFGGGSLATCIAAPFGANAAPAFCNFGANPTPSFGANAATFGATAAPAFGNGAGPFSPTSPSNSADSTPRAPPPGFNRISSNGNGHGIGTNSHGGFRFAADAAPAPSTSSVPFGSPPVPPTAAGSRFFGAPAQSAAPTTAAAAGAAASNVPELLSRLNLQRTTEGYWVASMELATLLGQTAESLAALHPRRPAGLTDDAWATVIVLGVLRRCLAAQREVWADMEAKALAWLAAAWPEGGRSVGSTVMALAKALTVLPKV